MNKISKFRKWIFNGKSCVDTNRFEPAKEGWNAACKHILKSMQYRNRMFEGNWQHEDVDCLMEDIKEMIEKG